MKQGIKIEDIEVIVRHGIGMSCGQILYKLTLQDIFDNFGSSFLGGDETVRLEILLVNRSRKKVVKIPAERKAKSTKRGGKV